MKKIMHVLRKAGLLNQKQASGFTLVSQLVSVFVGAAGLLGGWAAYTDFSAQWRVANAERQMDQYAQCAMTEIVNVLQCSMGAEPINSGRNSRWRVAIGELVGEHNGLNNQNVSSGGFPYQTDNYFTGTQYLYGHNMFGGFITMSHHADRGLLFNNIQPKWANSTTAQWVWQGRQVTNGRTQLSAFDQRDRMRMTEFSIDYPLTLDPWANFESHPARFKKSAIKIKIVMQYRYRSSDSFGLFGDDYIRERIYETTVCPTNHGNAIDGNQFYKEFIEPYPYG